MTHPLVSIVTPSYNQGKYLRRAIDSVLRQDYPHIEYFVIDGGSRDDSVEILKSYGDRLRWVSEPDRGQCDAINKGFALARGSLWGFLCSDDLLLPGAVATAVRHLENRPHCDLVYGRAYWIDASDRVTGLYDTEDFSPGRLGKTCFICQPAAFWRREIAERVGPLNVRLHFSLDYEYWLRMVRAGARFEHIPEIMACSRLHTGSKTIFDRQSVFRANIDVCTAQLGYADIGHFRGLWHHRTRERKDGWPRHFRGVPKFIGAMSYLHWGAHNGWHYVSRQVFRSRRAELNEVPCPAN